MNNNVDIVIAYVNDQDPIWREQYEQYKSADDRHDTKSISDERIRGLFSLKYVFRSIAEHAKFVNNIYLVVQSESQVPAWINQDEVKVVTHEEFIPQELLPTYNSHTLEMFLHKIPGLSNRFIYFNDDMILLKDIFEDDLFDGDIPRDIFYKSDIADISYHYNKMPKRYVVYPWIYMHPQINNSILAHKYAGIPFDTKSYYRPDHGPNPLNKLHMEDVYTKFKKEIDQSCTRFRDDSNMYIYSYRLCNYLKHKKLSTFTTEFLTLKGSPVVLKNRIMQSDYDCICINDDDYNPDKIDAQIDIINKCLYELFPIKCKYEKQGGIGICCVCKGIIDNIAQWVDYHLQKGVDKIIIYDIFGKNEPIIEKKFKQSDRIEYKNVKMITRAKQRYYKKIYKDYNSKFNWLIFIDPDEFIICEHKISTYLEDNKFDNYDIVKLNRKNYIESKYVGFDEKVKSAVRGNDQRVSFIGNLYKVYHSSTNVPNPASIYKVCNCDGALSPDPYYSNCSNNIFINRRICTDQKNLINKILTNGILTESLYNINNVSILEDKLKRYKEYFSSHNLVYNDIISYDALNEVEIDDIQDIDYIFPYVDMNDPIWFDQYKKYIPEQFDDNMHGSPRYDGHNLLKYKLRSIEKYMPWIRNIFMIVSHPSQVPDWIDTSKIKIIYHEDFIPKEYLPLFNSSSIEMFFGNIKELGEKFIYGNDDFYVMRKMEPYMFFRGNKCAVYLFEKNSIPTDTINANSTKFRQLGWAITSGNNDIYKWNYVWSPQHCHQAMFKSTCIKVFEKYKDVILGGITKFREDCNCNQYLYTYYNVLNHKTFTYQQNYTGAWINGKRPKTQKLINDIKNNTSNLISIDFNDRVTNEEIDIIKLLFENKFPSKSKYEL